jgi:hypothetical protein
MRGTMRDELLFQRLIATSQTLVTVCGLAADNLSEEFKSMIEEPKAAVEAVLKQCDPNNVWDGTFRAEDCEAEPYTPDLPDADNKRKGIGVKLTHIPTGMSVLTYGSEDRDENYKRAMRALKNRVEARSGSVV